MDRLVWGAVLVIFGCFVVPLLGLTFPSLAKAGNFLIANTDQQVPVPLGQFEGTDEKENYANYIMGLRTEFRNLAATGLLADQGKLVRHRFSKSTDGGLNNSYVHDFNIDGSQYKFQLKFELDVETVSSVNVTSFKYKYWFEPGQGLHADYNIPPENPMQIQHLYEADQDGFVLVYKLGDVIAKRRYKRIVGDTPNTTAAPQPTVPKN